MSEDEDDPMDSFDLNCHVPGMTKDDPIDEYPTQVDFQVRRDRQNAHCGDEIFETPSEAEVTTHEIPIRNGSSIISQMQTVTL